MAFALNIVALILVIGICWFAMVWLSGRMHGTGESHRIDKAGVSGDSAAGKSQSPCDACDGSGARTNLGRLAPCPVCEGTGVSTPVS